LPFKASTQAIRVGQYPCRHLCAGSKPESYGSVLAAKEPGNARVAHGKLTPLEREQAGVSERLIRLSVGLESPTDITHDLATALSKVHFQHDPMAPSAQRACAAA